MTSKVGRPSVPCGDGDDLDWVLLGDFEEEEGGMDCRWRILNTATLDHKFLI